MLRVASSHTHDLACSRYSVRLSSLCDACNDAACNDDDAARDPCNDNDDNDDDNDDNNDDGNDNDDNNGNNDGNDDNNDDNNDDDNDDNNADDNDDDDRIPLSLKLLSKYSRARYIFLLVLWTLSLV